jgi:hypothetical protein
MWNALLTHALRPQLMDAATTIYRGSLLACFVRLQLMEVFVITVKKSWRLCVHFSANG